MSYRGNPARGRSSLGYLFGHDDTTPQPPRPTKNILPLLPPYGTDNDAEIVTVTVNHKPTSPPFATSHHDSETSLTNSPSTKIRSSPGGKSSLGYLFGDNK
ncbi:hypothetical protein PIB30_014707 [Stylosanthes scabra]|uniref:Protein SPIRAL1-like 5 n=1 Tax=Stylosanthes scabra TaxID=79078 RepID=A0ABU6U8D9_9FABA|nr:hypothetical protein [Stylosanthes scabra]